MRRLIYGFAADKDGATAIEYGLLAALLAVALIGSLTGLSGSINNMFGRASATISGG